MRFPSWFIKEYGAPIVVSTPFESGWAPPVTFYHITPTKNIPTIMRVGLRVPVYPQDVLFTLEGREPVKGIYLEEDKNFSFFIAWRMYERKPNIGVLSLLVIDLPIHSRYVADPEAMGAIIVLDPIPPEAIIIEVYHITHEIIEEMTRDEQYFTR